MRVGWVLLSLLLAAGCGEARSHAVPSPSSKSHHAFRVGGQFDAEVFGSRLAARQRGWPGPRMPVAPPPRKIDCRQLKCVALTFDDGPGDQTGHVLDVLAAHHARATFFMLGEMVTDNTRDIVRRMVSEGHELGNHSWGHPSLVGLSEAALRRELERTQDVVQQATGVRMRVMRPPYGSTNHEVEAMAKQQGLAQIMWDLDTLDWRDRNAGLVAKRSGEAKPGDIVLMHDIHPTTVEALPRLLDELDRKKFTYVTVPELLGGVTPGKQYHNK
ncbi:polysaccharide deacetylase family protein [Planotetraspora kaengkrachanensis]|uniref:NodB homology domain-containing protein n=1 Tax=Planotetraspora kaengkrachanensis TaxID=575193 RepID=A0A8J3V9E0_9ACTN|nr:polysaccharide deacetylase family protein [Planotetraspora kaengkrachanensis]GIG82064.1 hypothetical protein Pka01_51910 [Planotetraspora kaengkrachanensis]